MSKILMLLLGFILGPVILCIIDYVETNDGFTAKPVTIKEYNPKNVIDIRSRKKFYEKLNKSNKGDE